MRKVTEPRGTHAASAPWCLPPIASPLPQAAHEIAEQMANLPTSRRRSYPRLQWLTPTWVLSMTASSSRRCSGFPTKSISEALTTSSGPSL